MLGLEATTLMRRASGSGWITLTGNSQIGDLMNQTISMEMRTAWNTSVDTFGMISHAVKTNRLSAVRIFARKDPKSDKLLFMIFCL